MSGQFLTIEQTMTLLTDAPGRFARATAILTSDQLHSNPEAGEWSIFEIFAHARSCADVWGDCLKAILTEDHPSLEAGNPRARLTQADYLDLEFHASLIAFTAQRAELVAMLEPLAPDEWARSATITKGRTSSERTALYYARWIANHEHQHVKQVERLARRMSA